MSILSFFRRPVKSPPATGSPGRPTGHPVARLTSVAVAECHDGSLVLWSRDGQHPLPIDTAMSVVSRLIEGHAHRAGVSAAKLEPTVRSRARFVYLMINDYGFYKIGVASDVERRRGEIERSSGVPVRVVASRFFPDAFAMESQLHARFAAFREEGEWFSLPPLIVDDLVCLLHEGS